MVLKISDEYNVEEVKTAFSKHYPFLELVFYHFPSISEGNAYSESNEVKDTGKTLAQIRHRHTSSEVSINGHLKVRNFESLLWSLCGLRVRVFARSSTGWVNLAMPGEYSLTELNQQGENMSVSGAG